jgi:hypothetical protein
MFIPHPEQAAREMRRVTRPGGIVAACTWDREGLEMTAIFWEEAIRLDPDAAAWAERPSISIKPGISPPCGTRQVYNTSKRRPSKWAWSSPPLTITGNRISQAMARRVSTSRRCHQSTATRYGRRCGNGSKVTGQTAHFRSVRKRGPCAASCRRRHELRSSSPTRAWS